MFLPCHLPPLTTSISFRASLRFSGYLCSSSPFRAMYEVSRPVVVLSTFALLRCSHKTLLPLLSVMLSLLLALGFVCHSPRLWEITGYRIIGQESFCNTYSKRSYSSVPFVGPSIGVPRLHSNSACFLKSCRNWPWVQSGFLTLHSFVS